MSHFNQVLLIGHMGEDPEILKEDDSGVFARLSIATNKRYTNEEGDVVQDTQWHTVYVSNGVGKYACTYFKKGAKVFVSGELRTQTWDDKKTGEVRYATAVYAKECKLLSKPQEKDDESSSSNDNYSGKVMMIKSNNKATSSKASRLDH